ncbi:carbohydrate kinase [candidate division KSB1 bacterium]
MQKIILSYGEILWDILPTETILGGAPFNFAYRINSLGERGIFVSRLGKDEQGEKALKSAESLGIDTSYLQWDEKYPTGKVLVSFDEEKNPDYVIVPEVAYDYIEITDKLKIAAQSADCFSFGTLVQRSPKTRSTLEQLLELSEKSIKLLDINLRKKCYSPDTITQSLKYADILKLNDDEAVMLFEILNLKYDTIENFCTEIINRYSLSCCLVTMNEKGAFAMSEDNQKVYVPGYKLKLQDSLGSGDAFTAGFIHNYLRGSSLKKSCEFGNILGAICATQKGATQPITREMIDTLQNTDSERLYAEDFDTL